MMLTFLLGAKGLMITFEGLHPSALVFLEVNMYLYKFWCLLSSGSAEHSALRIPNNPFNSSLIKHDSEVLIQYFSSIEAHLHSPCRGSTTFLLSSMTPSQLLYMLNGISRSYTWSWYILCVFLLLLPDIFTILFIETVSISQLQGKVLKLIQLKIYFKLYFKMSLRMHTHTLCDLCVFIHTHTMLKGSFFF